MQKVDRLIIKARQTAQRKSECFTLGIVSYEPDKGQYAAMADLSGVTSESYRRVVSYHESIDDAVTALHVLADEYPNTESDASIIIDDIPAEGESHVPP